MIVHVCCLALHEGFVEKWLRTNKGVNKSKPLAHEKKIDSETNFSSCKAKSEKNRACWNEEKLLTPNYSHVGTANNVYPTCK